MNKQELISMYERINNFSEYVSTEKVIKNIQQLDDQPKPVIPKTVADWIEKCKTFDRFHISLTFALQPSVWEANGLSDETIEWLMDAENQDLFARAWLDGYEVEKEKRYRVKMRGVNKLFCFLSFQVGTNGWIFDGYRNTEYVRTHHTRKQLEKANFGWVFDCPGVEVQEVEE
mgnify:CR=1 FL=1